MLFLWGTVGPTFLNIPQPQILLHLIVMSYLPVLWQGYCLRRSDTVRCGISICVSVRLNGLMLKFLVWGSSYFSFLCLYCTVRLTAVLTRAIRHVRSAVGRVRGQTGSEGHQVYLRDSDTYCFLPLYGQSEGARPAERPAALNVDKNIYASFLKVRLPAVHPSRFISLTAVTNVIGSCWTCSLYVTKQTLEYFS